MGGCAAPNCGNRSGRNGLRNFKIPSDPIRRQQWLANCKRTSFPLSATICESHFDDSQFESHREDGWRKLKPFAVPTIFSSSPGLKIKKGKKITHVTSPTRPYKKVIRDSAKIVCEEKCKNNVIDNEEEFLTVKTGRRRCCICHKGIFLPYDGVAIAQKDNFCSDFGRMLCTILQVSESSLLTKYSCLQCSEQVLQCFQLIIDINVSTILTNRRFGKTSYAKALDQGCHYCGAVFPNIEEFTDHFMKHVLNSDIDKLRETKCNVTDDDTDREQSHRVECVVSDEISKTEKTESNNNIVNNPNRDGMGDSVQEDDVLVVLQSNYDDYALVKEEHTYCKHRRSKVTECSRVCHLCGKILKSRYTMRRHIYRHADPEFPRDQKTVWRQGGRKEVKVKDLDSTPLICDHCGATFTQRFSMVNHMVLQHGGNLDELYRNRGKRRAWQCNLCGHQVPSFKKLAIHSRDEHPGAGEPTCQCELCGKRYKSKSYLRKHIKSCHVDHYSFRCNVCGRRLRTEETLQSHMLSKHYQPDTSLLSGNGESSSQVGAVLVLKKDDVAFGEDVDSMGNVTDLEQVIFNIPGQHEEISSHTIHFVTQIQSATYPYGCL